MMQETAQLLIAVVIINVIVTFSLLVAMVILIWMEANG